MQQVTKNSMQQQKQFFLKKSKDIVPSLADTIRVLKLIDKSVIDVINIVMWPPLSEQEITKAILSCNLVTDNGISVLVDTASNQYTILVNMTSSIEVDYSISEIEKRFEYWSKVEEEIPELKNEVFRVSGTGPLSDLLGKRLKNIYLLNIGYKELNPFGLRFTFENGRSLFSYSNTYGNFVQSDDFMNFKKVNQINGFLGECVEIDIFDVVE